MTSNKKQIRSDNFFLPNELAFFMRPLVNEKNSGVEVRDPHRHTYYEIIYFKKGEAIQNIDDKIVNLKTKNTFYFIEKGQVHDLIKGKNMKGFIIRFAGDFIPSRENNNGGISLSALNNISRSTSLVVDKTDVQYFENLLDDLFNEYSESKDEYGNKAAISNMLSILLIAIQRRLMRKKSFNLNSHESNEKQLFYKFIELLENNFIDQHGVEFYAQQLGISKRKLTEISILTRGLSSKKVILERLITEAKRLLLYTGVNSKEISFKLGFESPSYFNRVFKAKTNMTPSAFRKSTLSKERHFFH